MNNYDKINVPNFKEGKPNGYLCSMCGQYTTLSDSVSHIGWNLVCCRCERKMRAILKDSITTCIDEIQSVGRTRSKRELELKGGRHE